MYIVTVIPFTKERSLEKLTYFSAEKIPEGNMVEVPMRSKFIKGIVTQCEDAIKFKTDIKKARFKLKKIKKNLGAFPLPSSYNEMISRVSKFYATNDGTIWNAFFPLSLGSIDFNKIKNFNLKKIIESNLELENKKSNLKIEKYVLQKPFDERITFLKTYIRESFARKESIHIILPFSKDLEIYKKLLSRGIENFVITFESKMTKKELHSSYSKLFDDSHPLLIISTAPFIALARADRNTIIIENESQGSYIGRIRPYVDARILIETFANTAGIKLILSDTILRPEVYLRLKNNEFEAIGGINFRLDIAEKIKIINTKNEREISASKENEKINIQKIKYQIIDEAVITKIKGKLKENKKVFVFVLRSGLAPITVCNDCAHLLECSNCSKPLVLYLGENMNERIYYCSRCKVEYPAKTTCKNCGSWNLHTLGFGIEEVRKLLEKEIEEKLRANLIIGQEADIYNITAEDKVDTSIITSFDSLFSIPSYTINRKILDIVININERTENEIIIQTRIKDNPLLNALAKNTILSIFEDELLEREKWSYPPYARLIKISYSGSKNALDNANDFLKEKLFDYKPEQFDGYIKKRGEVFTSHTLLRIKQSFWPNPSSFSNSSSTSSSSLSSSQSSPDPKLSSLLSTLPPQFRIEFDPEDIFG